MSENGTNQKGNGKSNKVLLIVLTVVVVLLLAVIGVMIIKGQNKGPTEETKEKRNVVVNKENVEGVAEEMAEEAQEYVEPGYYTVTMNTEWHFPAGDAVSTDARVDNLLENTHDVYFDVFLADNEEEPIYCSPVIPRGSSLESIALDKPLGAGTHDCVMVYHLVDEEQNTISTLRVAFQIIVEQ